MPHCTIRVDHRGPIIPAYVGVSIQRKAALQAANQPVPPAIPVNLLLDTGASITAIDISIIAKLGLTPTGSMPILTPSTGTTPHVCATYDIELAVAGMDNHTKIIPALQIIEGNFSTQGHHGLIGRDVLVDSRMIYSGPDQAVLLSLY